VLTNFSFKKLFKCFLYRKSRSINDIFEYHFFEQKYFLQQFASEADFAKLLNISPDILNQISKTYYFNTFSDLIEEYRYLHFLNEFENPINAELPFDSVIKLSGFENNVSFINYIKEKRNNSKIN
jgi:hypothetical protein